MSQGFRDIRELLTRTIKQVLEESGEAHVLDIGTGTGILAISAAKAGATSVVACDLHASLCDIARKTAAASGYSKKISVVHRDAALLQRGKEVRPLGTNVVIADMFDAGLLGNQFEYILSLTRRKVVQPGAKVIPQAATVYCMGIEAVTRPMEGVKLACFDRYRWDSSYEVVDAGTSSTEQSLSLSRLQRCSLIQRTAKTFVKNSSSCK
eukprot:jgi/Picre1/29000/NNA_004394.t1